MQSLDTKLSVQIRRLADVPLPEYQTLGAAGFDLCVSEEIDFAPQQLQIVSTGLAIATPAGYFLMLTPRSSLFKRRKLMLVNSPGIVDADYSGDEDEIKLALLNPTVMPTTVAKNERVAQGIFVPTTPAMFDEVERLQAPSRGGFGSTGF